MRTLFLLSILFLHTSAQYIQHWYWQNQGQGFYPYWRPDANTPLEAVLQSPAILEYDVAVEHIASSKH